MLANELSTNPTLDSAPLFVNDERIWRRIRVQKQLCRTCWILKYD